MIRTVAKTVLGVVFVLGAAMIGKSSGQDEPSVNREVIQPSTGQRQGQGQYPSPSNIPQQGPFASLAEPLAELGNRALQTILKVQVHGIDYLLGHRIDAV